jgi:RNA polymerase sigma-70 factor (ECF subfamily)
MTQLENNFLSALADNQQRIARICDIYAEDEEDGKDLYQEVMLQLWKSFASYREEAQISTWIYRVCLNTCIRKKYRNKQEMRVRLEDLDWIATEPETADERITYLRQCISHLRDADQMLVILYLEDLSYREIKEIVGISENHVAVKMKRIRDKLFQCINKKL